MTAAKEINGNKALLCKVEGIQLNKASNSIRYRCTENVSFKSAVAVCLNEVKKTFRGTML